jgi:signal transduction histidine kinase
LTVRFKIALTIFITGALTALGVIATVLFAFQRFEHESAYHRADAFLGRVMANYDNLFEMNDRYPEEFNAFLRNLVLFEPDTQLYLLDAQGTVLVSTGQVKLPAGFKVALAPVLEAAGKNPMPYVLGDDPERMDSDAVIAARAVRRSVIRSDVPVSGYLYVVCHKQALTEGRSEAFRSAFARPALAFIIGVVLLTTLLALWIIASVTRPLRQLTDAVASISARGLEEGLAEAAMPQPTRDELGQLTRAFEMMLATTRKQWAALRRLDHFRREGVSNLSHDLRSPLTATVACLETLDGRWADEPARAADRALVEMALRNTRNAARLVQSLGDLAQLDEPEFKLRAEVVDAGELLDDIALRFAPRAALQGVKLTVAHADADAVEAAPPFAALDIELFERAIANLIDNALKFCPAGAAITLAAIAEPGGPVRVSVSDTGPGIAAADLPHLFDRFYQSRQSVAPATGEGGKGLGLAIVKRIAELHGGELAVESVVGHGTRVTLSVPAHG